MRVETNEALIRRKRRISQYLFFGSFGVPLLGLLILNQQTANPTTENLFLGFIIPLVVLPLAYIITMVSVRMANQWVRVPRPEKVIPDGLKGIGSKSVLYNYYHDPARHVLFAPQGVFAIVTRFQDGQHEVEGNRWSTRRSAMGRFLSIFRMENIGNPTEDALKAAAHVQSLLAPVQPDVVVQPIIVFLDPRVSVKVIATDVPIVYASPKHSPSLKDYVRDVGKKPHLTLTLEQIEEFERATLPQ